MDHFNANQLTSFVNLLHDKEDYDRVVKHLIQNRNSIKEGMLRNEREHYDFFLPIYHTIDALIAVISPTDCTAFIQHNKN